MVMKMMRPLCYAWLVALLLPAAALADVALPEMIDQAGLQRMLTQRMIKAYAQILTDIDPVEAKKQLEDAAALFDKQLDQLARNARSEPVQTALQETGQLWREFRLVLQGPVGQESLQALLVFDVPLLNATNDVVLKLQEESGTVPARLVNTAGRQRMLSQRIAKLYMLASSGFHDTELDQQMLSARYEFEGALAYLQAAPENTREIQQGLTEVGRQWVIFRTSFQLNEEGGERKYIPFLVARAAEKILMNMDQITAQYVELDK